MRGASTHAAFAAGCIQNININFVIKVTIIIITIRNPNLGYRRFPCSVLCTQRNHNCADTPTRL